MPELSLSARRIRIAALCVAVLLLTEYTAAQQKTGKNPAGTQQGAGKQSAKTQSPKTQPPKPSEGKDTAQDEVLTASDGWPIYVTYYESAAGKESPVVILLPGAEGPDSKDVRNRRVWQSTALALQKSGFAVVSVDLRKHGDSLPTATGTEPPTVKMNANDYVEMVTRDMEAVKAFLMDRHKAEKLNIRKLSIVSVGSSAMVSAAFAVADWAKKPYPDGPTADTSTPRGQDVRALIMYSPNSTVKNIKANVILGTMKGFPIAVHIVASKDNVDDLRSAEKIYKAVELKGDEFKDVRKITLTEGKTHAEGFLEGAFADTTNKGIVDFLTKNVKDWDSPWASRKDRRQD